MWLFSTSWSGREKEVLFAVWQELREEGGGKKNVQKCPGRTTVPHPAASPPPPPQFAFPRRAEACSKQDSTFRVERHCSWAIKAYKRTECWEILTVQSKADLSLSYSTLFWDTYSWPWEEGGLWFDAVWHFLRSQEGVKKAWILFA